MEHRRRHLEATVALAAPADDVWAWVTTPAGVNDELRPLLRMTVPAGWQGAGLADLTPPVTVGRSWLLAGGIVPFDWDHLHLAAVGDRSFAERSSMGTCTSWWHDRSVTPAAEGCVVHDQVSFVLRRPLRWLPGAAAGYAAVVARIFAHRHRRLVTRFGSP